MLATMWSNARAEYSIDFNSAGKSFSLYFLASNYVFFLTFAEGAVSELTHAQFATSLAESTTAVQDLLLAQAAVIMGLAMAGSTDTLASGHCAERAALLVGAGDDMCCAQ